MTTTATLDATVLDLLADDAIIISLSRVVAVERTIRDLYAKSVPSPDGGISGTFATMQDAAAAIATPVGAASYNAAQTERRIAVHHAREFQNDAFEDLRRRITLVAENLVRDEVAQ